MSTTTRNFITWVVLCIVGFFVVRWVVHLALGILWSILPLAIIGGGLYVAYQVFGKKALSGGRRTLP